MNKISTVCVFCASSPHVPQIYKDHARLTGELLAANGISAVTGGGAFGLMASLHDGILASGGSVKAVIPEFMIDAGWLYPGLNDVCVTADMQERKRKMLGFADAVLVLPGGCGTLDEAMEVLTLKQLGLFLAPIVFVNTNGYYDLLIQHLLRQADECFMNPEHRNLWAVADTPAQAVELVKSMPGWDPSRSKLSLKTD